MSRARLLSQPNEDDAWPFGVYVAYVKAVKLKCLCGLCENSEIKMFMWLMQKQ